MENVERDVDRSAAKKYFKGAGMWPWLLVFAGIGTFAFVIGIFLIIAGIIWIIVGKLSAEGYEQKVDEILADEQEYLLQRGMERLSLVEQQAGLIEPIKTVGMSYQPALVSEGKASLLAMIKNLVGINAGNAPVLISRASKEGKWRFSLNQVNIFIFGETQLYIYFAHVDITTGLVFREGTHEYFYKDICGITTAQELESKFNIRKRKWQNVVLDFIHIYTPGCNHSAGFNSSSSISDVDKQITAMRNLIREKKEEK